MTLGAIRAIELQRVATWMLIDILKRLRRLQRELIGAVIELARDQPNTRRDKMRLERQIESEVETLIGETMTELKGRIVEDYNEIIAITVEDERRNFQLIYGLALSGVVSTKASDLLVFGSTVEDHMDQIGNDLKFRIMSQVRDSIAAGEAEELLYNRLKGGKTVETPPGEFGAAETKTTTVIRTGVEAIPNEVASELEPRANVISEHGWQHISVLDSRTTQLCRGRAFKRWTAEFQPIGHDLPFRQPPLHANCRSRIQLIFVDDDPAQDVNFRQWTEQLTKQQRDGLFGEANIKSWEKSRISDSDLIRQQNRPMTLDELRKRTESKQGEFPFL